MHQGMTGQPGKGAEITLGTGIRGDDFEHRAAGQSIEFEFGLEQRQRAIEAAGIEFGIKGYSVGHGFTPGKRSGCLEYLVRRSVSGYSKLFVERLCA